MPFLWRSVKKFPMFRRIHTLNCDPYGGHRVCFDIMDEDDDFLVTEDLGLIATGKFVENWEAVWNTALPMLNQLLLDYEQGVTVAELFNDSSNTLNVLILMPEDDDPPETEFRADLFIDKKTRHGSNVFGVGFRDLEAESASATF